MSDFPLISGTDSVALTVPVREAAPHGAATVDLTPADEVEISQLGQALSALVAPGEIRTDKVAAVREAIANGTYETPDKIDFTVSCLLDELRQ